MRWNHGIIFPLRHSDMLVGAIQISDRDIVYYETKTGH